jgi:hypothetical protein
VRKAVVVTDVQRTGLGVTFAQLAAMLVEAHREGAVMIIDEGGSIGY